MSALTHQERAERAVKALLKQRWMRVFREIVPSRDDEHEEDFELIAREMYPAELVEAAKGIAHSDQYWTQESWDAALDKLESALALYPEPQEEPDHE